MRGHPTVGERIVREAARLTGVAPAVRHHHERWDGAGYPDRLAGAAIPEHAQLVSLADAYAAIRVGRPYQVSRAPQEAIAELRQGIGSQFDPRLGQFLTVLAGVDLVP